MKLVIQTQYRENYGLDSGEDYWKNKGGSTYVVEGYEFSTVEQLNADAEKLCALIEYSNKASEEYGISWEIVEDSWESEYVRSQREYDDPVMYLDYVVTLDGTLTKKFRGFDRKWYETKWNMEKGQQLSAIYVDRVVKEAA